MDSRYLKEAISDLDKAGVIHFIYASAADNLPLNTPIHHKKFKLLFLDVGLLIHATKLDIEFLMNTDLMLLTRGAVAEQLAGQELMAYQDP